MLVPYLLLGNEPVLHDVKAVGLEFGVHALHGDHVQAAADEVR